MDDGTDGWEGSFHLDVLAIFSYCPSRLKGSFILLLLYVPPRPLHIVMTIEVLKPLWIWVNYDNPRPQWWWLSGIAPTWDPGISKNVLGSNPMVCRWKSGWHWTSLGVPTACHCSPIVFREKKTPLPLQYSIVKRKLTLRNLLTHCRAIACQCQTRKVNLSPLFLTPSVWRV
jgi:hypothetical protein